MRGACDEQAAASRRKASAVRAWVLGIAERPVWCAQGRRVRGRLVNGELGSTTIQGARTCREIITRVIAKTTSVADGTRRTSVTEFKRRLAERAQCDLRYVTR